MTGTATTIMEGEYFLHKFLWRATRHQLAQAATGAPGFAYDDLAAMVLAFNTLEAYLNFAGERLAPTIWQDERNYFRKEPFRGFAGKIKKIFELCDLVERTRQRHETIRVDLGGAKI